jgi:hypothetical protein
MPTDAIADRGFLLAEEEALKAKLSRLYVSDPNAVNGRRRVHVRWGYPMAEVNRQYPFLSIDLIDIEFAADRAHSAQVIGIDYWPSEYATFAEYAEAYSIDYDPEGPTIPQAVMWHPYNLHFQIATHARSAQHDLEITRILLGTTFTPHRWGWLYVPADDSNRWLDLVDWATANYNEGTGGNTNRIFRKIFHIVVSAHLPPENPFVFQQVLQVHGSLRTIPGNEEMGVWDHEAPEEP